MSRSQDDPPVHEGRTQIGKAVILIVVTAIIAVLVLHNLSSSGGSSKTSAATTTTLPFTGTTTPKHHKTKAKPLKAPGKVKLQVLNGLLTGSLAGNLSMTLKASPGYDTLAPQNTTAETSTSIIYVVTPGFDREAKALAKTLGLSDGSVHRGVPASAPVPSTVKAQANLIVVIGTSLQAKAGS